MDSWVIEMIATLLWSFVRCLPHVKKKSNLVFLPHENTSEIVRAIILKVNNSYCLQGKKLYISICRNIGYRRLYQLGLTFVLNMFCRTLIRQLFSYPEAIEYIVL